MSVNPPLTPDNCWGDLLAVCCYIYFVVVLPYQDYNNQFFGSCQLLTLSLFAESIPGNWGCFGALRRKYIFRVFQNFVAV
jgi:hypothetical protein